ncbi:MAG: rhamnan synthesis F family protein [Pseudomonadota bacterium]
MNFIRQLRTKIKIRTRIKIFLELLYNLIPVSLLEIESYRQANASINKKVCFFAAWDPEGIVDKYVLKYLDELVKEEFDIYFITSAPNSFTPENLIELKKRCIFISRRLNFGLDFASWKLCYLKMPKSHTYEELLLTNDSIFGPIFPLSETFRKIEGMKEDVIGLTDNYQRSHHLQSYFLYFNRKSFSQFMPNFLKSIKVMRDKDLIIEKYEVGLSKLLVGAGYKLGSVFPVDNTIEKVRELKLQTNFGDLKSGFAVNSTAVFWHVLVEQFRFPFLKREVLTKDVVPIKYIENWQLFLNKYNQELSQIIDSYLCRTVKNYRK